MTCSACHGAFHPATGHRWSENARLCRACTLDFIAWVKAREAQFSRPWRKPASTTTFLEAAATSIRPI